MLISKTAIFCYFFTGFIGLFICFLPEQAAAQGVKKLTEQNVRDFVEETTAITSGQNLEMAPDEIIRYLERHLDERARFKSTIKYNVPGYPAQETALALDKKSFIESIEDGSKSLEGYETTVRIHDIKISSDGTKATLKTSGVENVVMPVNIEGKTQQIPVEGQSSCDQILMLKQGVIKMFNARCETTINFISGF